MLGEFSQVDHGLFKLYDLLGVAFITFLVEGNPQDGLFVVGGVSRQTAFDFVLEAAVVGFVFGI